MNWATRKYYYPPIILVNIHLAGLIGLFSSWKTFFLWLTPMSIVLSCFLVFTSHKSFTPRFFILSIALFLLGFFVEVAGVMTGTIFGSYHYGETLGFSVVDVPLVMGLNWLILIYCTGSMLNHFKLNTIVKSISGATILVLLDLLIEQVAIRNDFWHWKNREIPLQNFIAWWIISFVFLYGFFLVLKNNTNRLSLLYLMIQFGFFGSLVIFHFLK